MDPRAARSRQKLLDAARALFAERGPGGITHQNVAERAGVGRATAYRHWQTPEDLLVDTVRGTERSLLRPPDRPLRPWLRQELARLGTELADPGAGTVLLAVADRAARDREIAAVRDAIQNRTAEQLEAALAQAVADGEIADAPPAKELVAQLVGPLVYRVLFQGVPVDDAFIDLVVDGALSR